MRAFIHVKTQAQLGVLSAHVQIQGSHLNDLLAVRCDKWPAVNAGVNAARTQCQDQKRTQSEVLQGSMRLGTDKSTVEQCGKECFWVSARSSPITHDLVCIV